MLPTHTATAHPLIRPTASLRRNASTKRHFLIKPDEYTQQRDFPDCFAAYMAMSLCRTKSSSFVPGSALDAMPILADITPSGFHFLGYFPFPPLI